MSWIPIENAQITFNIVAFDGVYVPSGITVYFMPGFKLQGTGQDLIDIEGQVISFDNTISLTGNNENVMIGQAGVVWSSRNAGIVFSVGSNGLLDNRGTIYGYNNAIYLSNQDDVILSNSGTWRSSSSATVHNPSDGYLKEGTLWGQGVDGTHVSVINTGTIQNDVADGWAVRMDNTTFDSIINKGSIVGAVILGAGDDLYDGSAGRHTSGAIDAGDGNDTIYGGADSDSIVGGTGADSLIGGNGNDTFYVDQSGDRVIEAAGGGTDRVLTSISYALASNVENLATTSAGGVSAMALTGNTLANAITGNAGANVIKGGDGADLIFGGAGQDTLGGNSTSTLDDGDRDTFKFNSIADGGIAANTQDIIWGHFTGGTSAGDKIDLSAMATGGASSSFAFVGSAALTANHPGQVQMVAAGSNYLVRVNTDNDSSAEMTILVHSNSHTFVAGDFVL